MLKLYCDIWLYDYNCHTFYYLAYSTFAGHGSFLKIVNLLLAVICY